MKNVLLKKLNQILRRDTPAFQNDLVKSNSNEIAPITLPQNSCFHDFIEIAGTDKFITAFPINDLCKDSCFRECKGELSKRGMSMPTPFEFMIHLHNLLNFKEGDVPIKDSVGNAFSYVEIKNILKEITRDVDSKSLSKRSKLIWLNAEYTREEIEKTTSKLHLISQELAKIQIDEDSYYLKIGNVNVGHFREERGINNLIGGTGIGDTFCFYGNNNELFLDSKCNPIIIHRNPRVYAVVNKMQMYFLCANLNDHSLSGKNDLSLIKA